MAYLGTFHIDDYVGIPAATHRFSSGAAYAPTALTYSIYEEATDVGLDEGIDMVVASPFDSITGCYWVRRQLTAAAGFEEGKNYLVVVKATVDSVAAIQMHTFQVEAATVNANVTQISGDSTAADNAESFFDGTGYAGTNNVIPTVTTLTGHTAQTGDAYAVVAHADYGNAKLVRSTTPANTLTVDASHQALALTNAITNDAITAASIANGAIDAATFAAGAITATVIATGAIDADAIADGAIDNGAFAADAISAAKLHSDVTTELQSGLATSAELAKVPKSDSNVTWNATALASIQAEATDALNAYDPPTNAEMIARTLVAANYFDPAADTVANVTTVATTTNLTNLPAAAALEATLTAMKGATFSGLTDSLEALRDRGDAAWITATGFATPTNITAGTITTVTNLTNAPANGDLTATMKTSVQTAANAALVAFGLPTDDSIADAVWDETAAHHVAAGSTGKALADVLVDTAEIGVAGAGLTNINLPNQTMDITGSLSGSVGSVTGAVGSVTGAVGSVTGSVGSIAAGGIAAASFAAGAIDAAAIKDGAIDAATFAAGAITAAAIATNAIDADALAADGLAEIADAVWDEALAGHAGAGTAGAALSAATAPTAADVADAVWDEALAGHLGAGTTGAALNAAGAAGDPWTTALPGAYADGTAGDIIGNLVTDIGALTPAVAISATTAASVSTGALAVRTYHSLSQAISSTYAGNLNAATKLWLAVKAEKDDTDAQSVIFIEKTAGLTVLAGAAYTTVAHGSLTVGGLAGAWTVTVALDEVATGLLTPYADGMLWAECKALVAGSTVAVWDGVCDVARGIVVAVS